MITIVAEGRACLFGEVVDGVCHPNEAGRLVRVGWDELPAFYPRVALDAFVVLR